MNGEEIVQAVQKYVRNEGARYAILINGAWGSGKTYLYENYLTEAISNIEIGKNERKANVYISLYGISSIEALSKQVITNYLICAKANGNEWIKKGIKPISGLLGIASKAISFSVGAFSADFSNMAQEIEKLIEARNLVICFDDLERCTIPVNEFFGFVNNLVEHCNCKVIILADESNIGKVFANTNVEQKYLSVLTGDRKVVEKKDEDNRNNQKSNANDISIEELKKLNELLYSESYIYKDIKEKVIGKTLFYYPDLKDIITEIVSGKGDKNGYVSEGKYRDFLIENKAKLASYFSETDNRNLRIITTWIDSFRKIFDITMKYYENEKYYNDIIQDFLRYSIWVSSSYGKNKRIIKSAYHGADNYVYYEGHEYTHIFKYDFIDSWIRSDVWDEGNLIKASRKIIARRQREDKNSPKKIFSTGLSYSELRNWQYMEDADIQKCVENMLLELTEKKYAYYDFSNILSTLVFFQDIGLYSGDLFEIQQLMLKIIDEDSEYQEENDIPKSFYSEKLKQKYCELYDPISERRNIRNKTINREEIEDDNIYANAEKFYEHCKDREEYYCHQKAFIGFIDIDKLIGLINASDLKGIYSIRDALGKIYFMGNVDEFYTNDAVELTNLRKKILNKEIININGITRQIAVESLGKKIKDILIRLGVSEEEM